MRALWDNITRTSVHIIGVPEGEEREKDLRKILEEINFKLEIFLKWERK